MDLYSADTSNIQQGNMRTKDTLERNNLIQSHNTDVANSISNLRGQQATTATEIGGIQAAQQFWGGSKIPAAVSAVKKFSTAASAANPTSSFMTDAGRRAVAPTVAAADGAELVESSAGVFESAGALEGEAAAKTLGSSAMELGGKVLGGGIAAGIGGFDLYKDFAAGGIVGDSWEAKTSNILQIGGAVADVVGTVFPPAALLGGVVDVAAGIFGEVGTAIDEKKQQAQDTVTQASEPVATDVVQSTAPATTGRVS